MLTIPLRVPSTSASEASLKDTSHTLMIFCRSSSNPISLLSSEISAPWLFIQAQLLRLLLQADVYEHWNVHPQHLLSLLCGTSSS